MRIAAPVVTLELLDLLADRACLLLGVPAGGHLDLLARLVLGAQRLAEPALVVGDEVRGGGENVGGGAVIALEADDPGAGKIVLEAQDVVHLGPAPAVDRLVVISHAADVFEGWPCRGLGALPLPACGARVGVGGALPCVRRVPLTRRARHRSRCVSIGLLSAKNAGRRPAMLSSQAGRGGVRGAFSDFALR